MNSALLRRIKQLEKLVERVGNPEKPREVVLLETPLAGTTQPDADKFKADMSCALKRGAFVIVLAAEGSAVSVDESRQVKVVRSAWEADIEVLSRKPSKTLEGKTALSDLFDSLSGNVIGPVAQ